MPDIGRAIARGGRWPRFQVRQECPGCHQMTRPEALTVCGACWGRLPAVTRVRLHVKDAKQTDRLESVKRQLAGNTPLGQIQVAP